MTERYVSNQELAEHARHRPAEYVRELEACITRRDATGFFVDVDSHTYRLMLAKYRAVQQIPADFDPEQERRRMRQGGCCGTPSRE